MINQEQTDKLKDILGSSQDILLIMPNVTDLDLFLAAYCFYSCFAPKKRIRLLSPSAKLSIPAVLKKLLDQKIIETELGKENLLISFPYQAEQVDKVSYYIGEEQQRFYLTIKPKKGFAPLDSQQVEFFYAGAQIDLIFLWGVKNLDDLQQLYLAYEDLYQGKNNFVATINHHFVPDFGNLNLEIAPVSSYCEAVLTILNKIDPQNETFLSQSNLPSLLLYGIESKTKALQTKEAGAETFASVASLLKLGAKRYFKLSGSKKIKDS